MPVERCYGRGRTDGFPGCFLGGKASGITFDLVSGLFAISSFTGRENTIDESRSVPRDGAFHTRDFDDVYTDSDNHWEMEVGSRKSEVRTNFFAVIKVLRRCNSDFRFPASDFPFMSDFIFRQHHDLQYIVCEPLERDGFKNAFSTRIGGVSPLSDARSDGHHDQVLSLGNFTKTRPGDQREFVLENRRRFVAAVGASAWPLVTAKQIHSADIRSVQSYDDATRQAETCDALMAQTPRILLAIQTADCLPVLIVDERTKAFAAIHAGWRGTLAGIVARTVERMQREYDSRPDDLRAALGPGISTGHFEVGPEVLAAFRCDYDYADELIENEHANGKGHLNINQANTRQLQDCGVPAERIHDSGLCTVARNDLFFSHRYERGHEHHVGRLMSVVGIE